MATLIPRRESVGPSDVAAGRRVLTVSRQPAPEAGAGLRSRRHHSGLDDFDGDSELHVGVELDRNLVGAE
jgi:hypothetical protein